MIYGYMFRRSDKPDNKLGDYLLGPNYPISLQLFLEKYAVDWHMDNLERFVFLGDNPTNPDAIFVASYLSDDAAERALAEDFGLDIKLLR